MTRDIKCSACLHQGKIAYPHEKRGSRERDVFKNLGYDPDTGYLHFHCPACSATLGVNPIQVLNSGIILGFPLTKKNEKHSRLVKKPLMSVLRAIL